MAIKRKAGGRITGLAADPKPTAAAEPLNTIFQETDTHNDYINNGTAWVLYRGPAKTETLTNKTLDSDLNTVKLPVYSVLVYKSGTTYKAKNMETGGTLATTSTTDASTVINDAINNIPGAAARGFGGIIFIRAGDYDCKTTISADISTTSYYGVELVGEGRNTRLNFTPVSALTDGIKLRMPRPRLGNMRIYGNANVTNLIHILGLGTNPRVDYGILENLQIDGTPATVDTLADGTPTAGQKGIYMDGSLATFFWKFSNLDFRGLDIGAHLFNTYATSTLQNNISSLNCNIGEKISGAQHSISNCYFQGEATVGQYGIWLTSTEGVSNGSKQR